MVQKSGGHQLRSIEFIWVYPIVGKVLAPSQVVRDFFLYEMIKLQDSWWKTKTASPKKKVIFTLRRGIGWNWISYGNNIIIFIDSIWCFQIDQNYELVILAEKKKKHILKIAALNPKAPTKNPSFKAGPGILRPFFHRLCPTKPPYKKHTPQVASIFTKGKTKQLLLQVAIRTLKSGSAPKALRLGFLWLKNPVKNDQEEVL